MILATKNLILLLLTLLIINGIIAQVNSSNEDTGFNYDEQFELAESFLKSGDANKAMEVHYSILGFLQKSNNDSEEFNIRLAKNYQCLSSLYLFLNDSLSLRYADKAISTAEKTNNYELIERSYNLKYYCLYDVQGSANQLDNIADKCIEYSLLADNKKMLGEAYMNKCNALVELNRIDEGNMYCRKAEAIFMEIESRAYLSSVLNNIGNVFLKSDQFEKALSYHLKAYEISKELNNLDYLITSARSLAEDYSKIGNYKKATQFYKILTDSINASYKNTLDEKFTDSEAKFNAALKDKEIAIQKLDIANRKKTSDSIIFVGVVLILLIFAVFQWYLFYQKKKKQLIEQNLLKEQELNNLRKRFLENIAHEIRTPITLINGYLSLALEDNADKYTNEKHIKTALSNSEKVLSYANEILELLKMEKDETPLQISEIVLDNFFRRLFYSFESLAVLKKIKLIYISNINPNIAINSDKIRIEKILNNFLSNALKFSPSNTKIIFDANISHNRITIKVTDYGMGISSDEQQKIFTRFYQSSNASNIGGMGIGLSLASELAESLGGIISVESQLKKGSVFTFSFETTTFVSKQKYEEETLEIGERIIEKITINPYDKQKILIVEDNPEMNAYLREILCDQFNCNVAFDGIEGLQKVQSKKYNLIISDIMMPQLDGFEFKQRINTLPNYKNIPFIFITAKAQQSDRIEGFNMGIDDYITKPFAKEELLARINNLLQNKEERNNWAKENPDFVNDDKSNEEKLLVKVKSIVHNNLSDEEFKVSELAKEVAYSTRQLSRLLKKSSGLSPIQFILEIRLQKAYLCLNEKKFSTLAEVRNYVGMPTSAHFNKKFTDRFGIKPSEVLAR